MPLSRTGSPKLREDSFLPKSQRQMEDTTNRMRYVPRPMSNTSNYRRLLGLRRGIAGRDRAMHVYEGDRDAMSNICAVDVYMRSLLPLSARCAFRVISSQDQLLFSMPCFGLYTCTPPSMHLEPLGARYLHLL
jgi:hypothetical protein